MLLYITNNKTMQKNKNKILQTLFLLFLLILTFKLLNKGSLTILSSLDLILHEAGHLILMPFGQTIHMLGGTIGQLFFPVAFLIYFKKRKDWFASFVMFWWLGENLTDIGIYMADAKTRTLPLLGGSGSIHDWWWLFDKLNLLNQSTLIGGFVWHTGMVLMFLAIFAAFFKIYQTSFNKIFK